MNTLPKSHKILYLVYFFIWCLLAIDPLYRDDWFLENILNLIVFPLIIYLDKKLRFSTISLIMLFIFGVLHTIGSHFTYAQMAYFDYITQLFGFERNHYDRLVHFLFGLLCFKPLLEIVQNYIVSKKSALLFTLTIIISLASIYEIVEWIVAQTLYPELGIAFLGIQGDVWDAQKDIFVAILGAVISYSYFLQKEI